MAANFKTITLSIFTTVTVLLWSTGVVQAEVVFNWALVNQDLGNTADDTGFGSVGNGYRISKHEVTNTQYAEFLNAVDPTGTNSLGLYNGSMADQFGGITLNGANADSSKYVVNTGRGDHPVVFVDFYDSLRFSNWLHNGQGGGDTEAGAYTLLGGTPIPTNGSSVTRNTGAVFFLPSEDEWYKAAHYDPVTDSYFDYATSSNTEPTAGSPAGGINSANHDFSVIGNTTPVGAYTHSASPFGTFDQNGNVFEWNEALLSSSTRGLRGGSWLFGGGNLLASFSLGGFPDDQLSDIGFRVASQIPEPSTFFLLSALSIPVMLRNSRVPSTSKPQSSR